MGTILDRLVLSRLVLSRFAAMLLVLVLTSDLAAAQSKVTIAVGGGGCLCYLPTVLAIQLGEFERAGLADDFADLRQAERSVASREGDLRDVAAGTEFGFGFNCSEMPSFSITRAM